ncbi:MAG: exodeoxyribonuclease VII large subunit [Atopobiaceae bacterium]|nr:exodeoxyribonuclease VII large subunit [Atopobiaceae bacterium]
MGQPQPISVSDAIGFAKSTVDNMPTLLVTGEVSGFRSPARTGHCYFQLKDDSAAMDAIVWRGIYQSSGVELHNGLQVLMVGRFQIYEPTGRLSFVAKSIEASGEGLLRQQVAALAKRLEAEGLMDPARKKRIPGFCERIAVVTSPTGSVIDDVKRTLARRNPLVEVLVSGCAVQGEGAPAQIIRALARAEAAMPEAILLVRGGGSYEDLMTFNDESLARAVAACTVPVITGIGHEPDTCICDMVADRRCSTPTAAAESVAPAFDEILRVFYEREHRLGRAMKSQLGLRAQVVDALDARSAQATKTLLNGLRASVDSLSSRRCLTEPMAQVEDRKAQLELTSQRLHDAEPRIISRLSEQVDVLAAHHCLQNPMAFVEDRQREVESFGKRLGEAAPRQIDRLRRESEGAAQRMIQLGPRLLKHHEATLQRSAAQLEALSPLKVMARGYAIARDENGRVVCDAATLSPGDGLTVLLARGSVTATVQKVQEPSDDDGSSSQTQD